MNFGAHFARDTRPAPAETVQKSQDGAARPAKEMKLMNCVCAPLPRVARSFGAKTAQFFGRNSRDFARKFFKIGTMSAANARTQLNKDTDDL